MPLGVGGPERPMHRRRTHFRRRPTAEPERGGIERRVHPFESSGEVLVDAEQCGDAAADLAGKRSDDLAERPDEKRPLRLVPLSAPEV